MQILVSERIFVVASETWAMLASASLLTGTVSFPDSVALCRVGLQVTRPCWPGREIVDMTHCTTLHVGRLHGSML